LLQTVQYGVPVHAPPCGHGWDLSARDGMCYPNGYLPPQDQAARQYQRSYRGGHYPVPCGHGTDLDSRDGQCYPTGTVPPQYQQGRQQYYGDRYYRRPPQGRYYYQD
jgi:carbohydrate-selective porin OprB